MLRRTSVPLSAGLPASLIINYGSNGNKSLSKGQLWQLWQIRIQPFEIQPSSKVQFFENLPVLKKIEGWSVKMDTDTRLIK